MTEASQHGRRRRTYDSTATVPTLSTSSSSSSSSSSSPTQSDDLEAQVPAVQSLGGTKSYYHEISLVDMIVTMTGLLGLVVLSIFLSLVYTETTLVIYLLLVSFIVLFAVGDWNVGNHTPKDDWVFQLLWFWLVWLFVSFTFHADETALPRVSGAFVSVIYLGVGTIATLSIVMFHNARTMVEKVATLVFFTSFLFPFDGQSIFGQSLLLVILRLVCIVWMSLVTEYFKSHHTSTRMAFLRVAWLFGVGIHFLPFVLVETIVVALVSPNYRKEHQVRQSMQFQQYTHSPSSSKVQKEPKGMQQQQQGVMAVEHTHQHFHHVVMAGRDGLSSSMSSSPQTQRERNIMEVNDSDALVVPQVAYVVDEHHGEDEDEDLQNEYDRLEAEQVEEEDDDDEQEEGSDVDEYDEDDEDTEEPMRVITGFPDDDDEMTDLSSVMATGRDFPVVMEPYRGRGGGSRRLRMKEDDR